MNIRDKEALVAFDAIERELNGCYSVMRALWDLAKIHARDLEDETCFLSKPGPAPSPSFARESVRLFEQATAETVGPVGLRWIAWVVSTRAMGGASLH